jgi:hypothetical protein
MKITVKSEAARKNIELFKKIVERQAYRRAHPTTEGLKTPRIKTYAAFLNRFTGDLLFAEFIEDLSAFEQNTWKPICIRVKINGYPHGKTEFEILEDEKNESIFKYADLDPLALKVLAETIQILNGISVHLKTHVDVENTLRELSRSKVELFISETYKELIEQAWYSVDRIGAEWLLQTEEVGTFLFRKDLYAHILEEELSRTYQQPIRCWTLSVLELEDKVCDYTIVKWQQKWLFYGDDPNLEGSDFASLESLLGTKKDLLKKPLLNK